MLGVGAATIFSRQTQNAKRKSQNTRQQPTGMTSAARPSVIIVGGGFAGLAAARALARAPCEVTLVDRRNHHVFQPLLYQVATAALSPADICSPIRTILRGQRNCQVVLAEVTGVDLAARRLLLAGGYATYDYLVLAAGATHAYFGRDDWEAVAPGLKTIEDATQMRRRILLAFESAEYEGSESARKAALTFGIVGGGPTGVELAGAIQEIAAKTLPEDYKHIDTRTTRVILFEGGDRLLGQFPPDLSERARRDLERMGVEVLLNSRVTELSAEGAKIGDAFIPIRNVFWAAGVQASPVGRSLGAPLDGAGRVIVGEDLSIPGHSEVFVVGDMAAARSANTGDPVPGLAPAGMQMGSYVGEIIRREASGRRLARRPFVYHDRGMLAVIGRARAVAKLGRWHLAGPLAWWFWGAVHIVFLIGFRNRVLVLLGWFWNWVLHARDVRLITGEAELALHTPRAAGFVRDATVPDGNEKGPVPMKRTGPQGSSPIDR
jgi:NADH dehydrogenase